MEVTKRVLRIATMAIDRARGELRAKGVDMDLTSKSFFSIFAAVLMAAVLLVFAGCSSSGSASAEASSSASESSAAADDGSSSASSEVAASEEDPLVLGEPSAQAEAIAFTNALGANITGFELVASGSEEAPVPLMGVGQSVATDEEVIVLADVADGSLFDVAVICGDASYTLHDVDFAALDNATIRLEGDVAYLEYIADGNAISTLAEEYDRAHPPIAQDAPAEPAQVDAGAEAEPVYYDEPVYYEEPAATQAPAQSEDACVTDIVLR